MAETGFQMLAGAISFYRNFDQRLEREGRMSERQLVYEDFADKVGQVFAMTFDDAPAIALTLTDAELLHTRQSPQGERPPYSLIFLTEDERILPQKLYRLEHEALGEITIFLVPVGKDARGVRYQAVFN